MRTTLTLEPDVARMVAEEVHRRRQPFKRVVNDALRRSLTPRAGRVRSARYRVRPVTASLLPGIDRGKLNAVADEREDQALVAKLLPARRVR
jgi:hypothetical protein